MDVPTPQLESRPHLVDRLCTRASDSHDGPAYTFLADGGTESLTLTYGELDRRARSLGAWLQQAGLAGERALLVYPPGLEFVAAFLGCLYGGVTAVPAYPPGSRRTLPRLAAIARDARPGVVLTASSHRERFRKLASALTELDGPTWAATDGPEMTPRLAARWRPPFLDVDSTAFLQYTSGSTSAPKGVRVTHGNLAANEEMIRRAFGHDDDTVVVGWLPFYHDMGLIGNVLQPLWVGAPCVLMSPWSFLRKPVRWLEAISRYRATSSGGPDFAYDLCVKKTSPEERRALDLSSWRLAFNGAEPVRAATLESFAEAFGPCGFRAEAWYPCYGLAEATLFVTGGPVDTAPEIVETEGNRRLVSCGRPAPELDLRIVEPESGAPCAPGEVGEIWIAGPSVARGYRNLDAAGEETFGARLAATGEGPFLRTGDLGVLRGGELYVTGRLKDLVILRGRNLYPQDIEWSAESSHAALRPGGAAAFSVEAEGEERLVVVQEVERRRETEAAEAADAVRRAVAEEHEARVWEVVIVRAGAVPKTSSGKVRRGACRDAYLAGTLKVLARSGSEAEVETEAGDAALGLTRTTLIDADPESRRDLLLPYLRRAVAAAAHLPEDRIEPDAPLSALGLDSLAAVELEHRLTADLEAGVTMADLLTGISLRQVVERVLDRLAARSEPELPRMTAGGPREEIPLSAGQEALWFLARLAPASTAYHLCGAARIREGLDVAALGRAFAALVERHPALRTTFHTVAGLPRQRISASGPGSGFAVEDAGSWTEGRLRRRLHDEAYRPFDLERGPLVRLLVLEATGPERRLVLAVHHLVTDLWSLGVLLRELGRLYSRETGRAAAVPPPLAFTYGDWIDWQERGLRGPEGERLESYWLGRLAGVPQELDLPVDRPRPAFESFRGGRLSGGLDARLAARLDRLARGDGATLFMALLAVFQGVLHRYSGQRTFLVGTPVSGRQPAEAAGIAGYFVNPLPLLADFSGSPTGHELLARVRRTSLEAYEHQGLPFPRLTERLRESLPPRQAAGRSPLFQTMFALQRTPGRGNESLAAFSLGLGGIELELAGLTLESIELEQRGTPFELTMFAAEHGARILIALHFNTDLWETTTARRMLGHFAVLARGLAAAPDRAVSALPVLSPAESHEVLVEWSGKAGAAAFPEAPLDEHVRRQAGRTPEAVAVVFEGRCLSYGELDRASDRVAGELAVRGVRPEERVGIRMERSTELVAALLGVLKAGAAFVPLEPSLPEERLAFMIEDFREPDREPLILTRQSEARSTNPEAKRGVPPLKKGGHRGAAALEQAAYAIYTSGSTGRPKGTVNSHRGISNRLIWMREVFGLGASDRVLHKTPLSFDVSVWELFAPLVAGARLVVARPGGHRDPAYLADLVRSENVTVAHFVPSMLRAWLAEPGLGAGKAAGRPFPALGRVVSSGEALTPDLVAETWDRLGSEGIELHNLYGPTEAAVEVTWWRCPPGARPERVPIGRPTANNRTHVLDAAMGPAPAGVPGELHLGGVQLARGYLGRRGLTAERFVPDPFAAGGARLYRTGDRACWSPDGEVLYLGRLDDQLKVRGFRIEPGEIEAALVEHPAVAAAAVTARPAPDDDPRIVAYLVVRGGAPGDRALREHLLASLPEYMVPAAFVVLDELPLSPSGKLARRALPAPEWTARSAPYTPPRTPTERRIVEAWSEVLGLGDRRPGVDDDFFALGGHSLTATRVASRLRESLGVDLELRLLFERPTVARLAAEIDARRAGGREPPPIAALPRDGGPLPCSFAQERLWLLHQLEPAGTAYHMAAALRLRGELDEAALGAALGEVVRRHEALRTRFEDPGGGPVQIVDPPPELVPPRVDLSRLEPEARTAAARRAASREARRRFDLGRGPLLRVSLLRLGPRDHTLVVAMHHIVFDGGSTRVLIRELEALYGAFAAGRPSPLAPLPIQYADYAAWQRAWLEGEALERQLAYWRERLAGLGATALPTDRPRTARGPWRGATLPVRLADGPAAWSEIGRRRGATVFMTLLAVLLAFLGRVTGRADVAVGAPIANRRRREAEGLIGFFVNTLVRRADLSGDPRFVDLLDQVRAATLEADAHQDAPYERVAAELGRHAAGPPLVQVLFALADEPLAVDLPGLDSELGEIANGDAKVELSAVLGAAPNGFAGAFEYAAELFDAATARRLARSFEELAAAAAEDPGRRLGELPLLAAAERHQLAAEWNDTARPAPKATLAALFAARTAGFPERTAVARGDRALTYAELRARAGGLARRLGRCGTGPEARVGIAVDRSPDMVVSALGVLAAGAACVPLDRGHPVARRAFVLADARASAVVADRDEVPEAAAGVPVIRVDGLADRSELPAAAAGASHLAYVMYTSGSTGRPKGIQVSHGAIVNRILWAEDAHPLGAGDRLLMTASFGFDISLWEVLAPLLAGARLVLPSAGAADVASLAADLAEREITAVHFVPSLLKAWLDEGAAGAALTRVFCGGEALAPETRRRFLELGDAELHHFYGPTEAAISVTAWNARQAGSRVSIGRPIANSRIYLLDRLLRPVALGTAGELAIGGACLARGYQDGPRPTAERFVPDPTGAAGGGRIYRTGDLARCLADGRIEFLGRADHQLKLRGLRVEPGEVEAALGDCAGVGEAAVLARQDAARGQRLVAFWSPSAEAARAPRPAELRKALAERLPPYMIPAVFVELPSLPLTANGKVDRAQLGREPLPEGRAEADAEAPRTPAEELLAGIWSEVLGVRRVGVHDSFFDLGGHSLLATRAAARVREAFGTDLPLARLFERPTVAGLARYLGRADRVPEAPPIVPAQRPGEAKPLSFAQERLWFLDRLRPGGSAYNLPAAVRFTGDLRASVFHAALTEIVRRHEVLRTRFASSRGEPVQVVEPPAELPLPRVDLTGLTRARRDAQALALAAREARRPFDLERGPLLRLILLTAHGERRPPLPPGGEGRGEGAPPPPAENRQHVLILVLHHIVFDGWSTGVFLRELGTLYAAFRAGEPSPLATLQIQYADYAAWQRARLSDTASQLAYWRDRLADLPELELPTDRPIAARPVLRERCRRCASAPASRATSRRSAGVATRHSS